MLPNRLQRGVGTPHIFIAVYRSKTKYEPQLYFTLKLGFSSWLMQTLVGSIMKTAYFGQLSKGNGLFLVFCRLRVIH
jgi:hypothetical protein